MSTPINPLSTNLQMTQVSVDPNILGNLPVYANWEYTNSSIANAYAADIQAFVNIFNLGSTTASDGTITPNPVTDAQAAAVVAALLGNPPTVPTSVSTVASNDPSLSSILGNAGLIGLTQKMVEDPPGSQKYYGLTVSMANNLDQLLRTLQAAGWDGNLSNLTAGDGTANPTGLLAKDTSGNYAVLSKWRDLSITSPTIQSVLQGAVGAVQTNKSLQSSIESVYVATANDLISGKLSDLETQLSNSQDVLDSLSSIQNIHNQIVVSGKGSINFVYNVDAFGGDQGDFAKAYAAAASAHFGQPIIPHVPTALVTYGTPPLSGQLAILAQQQNDLKAQIDSGLNIINQQIASMEAVFNQVVDGKTVAQIFSDYYQAAKNYELAINQPGDLTDSQVIAAQQTYLNAANEYNKVFWSAHVWNGTQNTEGSSTTAPSLATNPSSPFGNSNLFASLSGTLITNPLAVPPDTAPVTSADFSQINTTLELGDYIHQSIQLWNNVLKDNYNNFINQMNNKIDALNTQIDSYNSANPTLPQLVEQTKLQKYDDAGDDTGNDAGISSPAPDGSNYVKINNPDGTLSNTNWSSFINDWTGDSQGAGISYAGTTAVGTPFSAIPTMLGGNHGEDFEGDVNNINENAVLPTFNHDSNGAPVVNTVKTFGYYDKEGRPILTPQALTAQGSQTLGQLLDQRQKILDQITYLETVTPKVTVNNKLTFDPNSLVVKLRNVISDMNSTLSFGGAPLTETSPQSAKLTAFVNWILDSYDKTDSSSTSQQGAIQQNITFAITAAQSSNDSQKTQVQQFMFIFEEYYKSAAAILTQITEIIQKIAQGISR